MELTIFFEGLLGISLPFSIGSITHQEGEQRGIYIQIEVANDYRPDGATIHDYEERTWRHLDLFQYPCYLTCRVPKFKYKGTKPVVRTLEVPWARTGSGFSLLFEELAIHLVKLYGCVSTVAAQLAIYPQRLWTLVWHYAQKEQTLPQDMSKVKRIGFDETSKKKGHNYVTCFIDLDTGDLLMIEEGKDAQVVESFVQKAEKQGLKRENISDVSVDMSPAFGAGIAQSLPDATITYDKFHVSQLVQKAFDSMRKTIARRAGRTFNKWIFFKDQSALKATEQQELNSLLAAYPELDVVYEMKNNFKLLWQQPDKISASAFLSFWTDFAKTLKRKTMTTVAKTLDKHHQGIIQYFDSLLTNASLEGFNSKIQTMKRNARGYKNTETLMLMIRWHCA